jgi:hypothetical protein
VAWRGSWLELVLYVGEVEADQSLNRKSLAAEQLIVRKNKFSG